MSYKIDLEDANNLSNKVVSEKETRRRFLAEAKILGREKDMLLVLSHTDSLLKKCTNPIERHAIAEEGAKNVWIILGGGGKLFCDGKLIAEDK